MVDKHFSERQIDDAIDRAVRDLMSAEPRADLRARVLAELDTAPARLVLWPRLAFGGAALVVAAVLIAFLVPGPTSQPTPQPDQGRIAGTLPAPSSPGRAAPAPPAPGRAAPEKPVEERRTPAPASGILVPGRLRAEDDRVIQAASIDILEPGDSSTEGPQPASDRLRPIDLLRLPGLDAIGTSTPAIVITPIAIDQIDVPQLTPRR